MNVLLSHPTGNSNVRGVLEGLYKQNMLHSFHTSIACFSNRPLYKLTGLPLLREFRRRTFLSDIYQKTYTYPQVELGRMMAQKLKMNQCIKHEQGVFCVDNVYRHLNMGVAEYIRKQYDLNAVYAYEDGALHSFEVAKSKGIKCIYDLPIGHWRVMKQLLEEEKEKHPDWAMTLGGLNDSDEKLLQKDKELALADMIYVASSFTKRTLDEYVGPLAPIKVIPYGFPSVNKTREYLPLYGRKLKLLFVGGLSQRKGISYLFDAVKGLERYVELTIVGRGNVNECAALKAELSKHRYIPSLPHHEILSLMALHDIFVFPSLFEGFGLVITEAMSQGTPVITTNRTCGPDIIVHDKNGWIVDTASSNAICQHIEVALEHPEILESVGRLALDTAARRPWSDYGDDMANSIQEQIGFNRML